MNHTNLQNAEKALKITTLFTIIVAGYEVLCSCQNYQTGMNLLATERYIHFKKLYPMICETVKQHYVATYLGIAPESLSRIKKALKEE